MAKDGTNRGGARPGAGAKKKPLADKLMEGNPGKRSITVVQFDNAADLEGRDMPKPNEMLSAIQKDGKPLQADAIYTEAWEWLHERGCSHLISPQLLEMYAMSVGRWRQCEAIVTEYGHLSKHPTTGKAQKSPFVAMGEDYKSQANRIWMEIYQIVKENCSSEYSGQSPQDDLMEKLLTARKGRIG